MSINVFNCLIKHGQLGDTHIEVVICFSGKGASLRSCSPSSFCRAIQISRLPWYILWRWWQSLCNKKHRQTCTVCFLRSILLPQFGIRNLKNTSMILLSFRRKAPWSHTSRGWPRNQNIHRWKEIYQNKLNCLVSSIEYPTSAAGLLSKKQYAPNAEIRFMMKLVTDLCRECTIWAVFFRRSLIVSMMYLLRSIILS